MKKYLQYIYSTGFQLASVRLFKEISKIIKTKTTQEKIGKRLVQALYKRNPVGPLTYEYVFHLSEM